MLRSFTFQHEVDILHAECSLFANHDAIFILPCELSGLDESKPFGKCPIRAGLFVQWPILDLTRVHVQMVQTRPHANRPAYAAHPTNWILDLDTVWTVKAPRQLRGKFIAHAVNVNVIHFHHGDKGLVCLKCLQALVDRNTTFRLVP